MKITLALKQYAQASLGVAADATDEVVTKAVSDAIANGTLEVSKFAELTKSVEPSAADAFKADILNSVKSMLSEFVKPAAAPAPIPAAPAGLAQKTFAAAAMIGNDGASTDEAFNVRVKSAIEQYDDSRTAATYDKSSNPELAKAFGGKRLTSGVDGPESTGHNYDLDMPTQRSKAIAGVWFKHLALKGMTNPPASLQLNEHERDLLQWVVHNCKFVGPVGYNNADGTARDWCQGTKLYSDLQRKAVLDDSTSGGLYATPIEFDASVILTPLLEGELFPYVDITNVTRRRIESSAIGNPTVSWGTSEGTEVPLFNTDSLISAFNNNIHPLTGACEMGLDLLADSPVQIGGIIVNNYGKAFRAEMDRVIALGTGSGQPEGLFTSSAITTIANPVSSGAAATVGLYEALMFGIGKQYLQEAGMPPASRAVFIGNQTSYRRMRAIAVGSGDARRVFGMDQMSYRAFDFRYAVNASISNAVVGFFCLNKYKLYRRQGLEVAVNTTDWSLQRANKQGILVRARFGGSLSQGAAGVKCITAEA